MEITVRKATEADVDIDKAEGENLQSKPPIDTLYNCAYNHSMRTVERK